MRRIAIRVANAVIFVLCTYLVASLVNQVSAELLRPTQVEAVPAAPPSVQVAAATWDQRKAILDRNLFGAQLEGSVVEEVPEPIVETVETRLPLRLLGTVAGDPASARAAIQDNGSRKHEIVAIGDTLQNHQGVEVIAIERGRILLRNGERHEELKLKEDGQQVARRANPRARARTRTPRPRRSRAESASLADRLGELAAKKERPNNRSAASLFSQARILPKYEDGQMVGMEISAIKEGSFYEQLGLQDGDVVSSLNGVEITSAADTAKILKMITQEEELEFQMLDGSVKNINAADLLDLVGEQE